MILCPVITAVAIVASFLGTEFTGRVFTSSAFYIVYGLLALNFLFCTWKHLKSPRRNTAFVLIHMGTLLVIGGASFGHFSQVKGFIWIEQQKAENVFFRKGDPDKPESLPFDLFLDRFWIQYYPRGEDQPLLVRAYPDADAVHARTPGLVLALGERPGAEGSMGDTQIRLEEIIPHAAVEVEEMSDHLLLVEIKETGELLSFPVVLDESIRVEPLNAVITPRSLFYDAKVRMQGAGLVESSDQPNNPALHIELVLPAGSKPEPKYLFARYPEGLGTMMGDHGKEDSPYVTEGENYRLVYRFPKVKYSAKPGGEDGIFAVKIAAIRNGETVADWYSPTHGLLPRFRKLFDDVVVEVVDPYPPQISDYKSKLTVYEDGEMVKTKIVEVNHPLSHRGYTFYQHDYDQAEGRYTVLQVVKDPGVWVVMVGFACIMLGVLMKFYIHPFLRPARKEAD